MTIRAYVRVSTLEQCTDSQCDDIVKLYPDAIFYIDKVSGSQKSLKDRIEFRKMISELQEGDWVIAHRLDRLGRSVMQVLDTIDTFKKNGVKFHILKENLKYVGDASDYMGNMLIQLLSVFAEFFLMQSKERQMEGIRAAQARGKTWGQICRKYGRDVRQAVRDYHKEYPWLTIHGIAKAMGIHDKTVQRALGWDKFTKEEKEEFQAKVKRELKKRPKRLSKLEKLLGPEPEEEEIFQ